MLIDVAQDDDKNDEENENEDEEIEINDDNIEDIMKKLEKYK